MYTYCNIEWNIMVIKPTVDGYRVCVWNGSRMGYVSIYTDKHPKTIEHNNEDKQIVYKRI